MDVPDRAERYDAMRLTSPGSTAKHL